MSETQPVSDTKASDIFLSLTGFDEIAIAKAFRTDVGALQEKPMSFLRAMAFIVERRGGAKDGEAYKTAMSMTLKAAGEYFPEEEDELDPEDPDTDEGKDVEPSE